MLLILFLRSLAVAKALRRAAEGKAAAQAEAAEWKRKFELERTRNLQVEHKGFSYRISCIILEYICGCLCAYSSESISLMLINALNVFKCRSFMHRSRKLDKLHPVFFGLISKWFLLFSLG